MPAQLFVGPYAPSGKKTIVAMVARASLVPIMGSAWRRTRARMIWNDLEAAAPEIAQLGKECFERARVALLGTLRRDGSPRISPVEPYLVHGQLLFGAMSWSLKTRDLLRDPALRSPQRDRQSRQRRRGAQALRASRRSRRPYPGELPGRVVASATARSRGGLLDADRASHLRQLGHRAR